MEATLIGPNGRTILGSGIVSIGRTPDNQLIVADAKASSHHADIRWDGQNYNLTDLGSTNGTFVNNQQLGRNVPYVLRSGDVVRIGDVAFTYTATDISTVGPTVYANPNPSTIDPTVYANPSSANIPNYQPTVAAPQPFTGYGQGGQQGGYQPPPPPPAYPEYNPYASPQQPYGQPMGMPAAGLPGYVPPVPATGTTQKPNRLGLWIGLSMLVAVIVIGVVAFFVLKGNGASVSTPTTALQAYCDALKAHDAHAAYQQLASSVMSHESEQQFVSLVSTGLPHITGCTVSNVNQTGSTGTGTISYTTDVGTSLVADYTLVQENGVWKITNETARPTS